MTLPFLKMHGLGNDFVVVDARARPVSIDPAAARRIADRRRGVGFDQLIVIEPADDPAAAARLRIRNADGGEVESCGNASRCVARLLMDEGGHDRIVVDTLGGRLACADAGGGQVTVDMGPARLDWREIPVASACDTLHMPIGQGPLTDPVGVNVGNPHAVFFVPDAETVPIEEVGPTLETDPFFPARVNVEAVSLLGPDRLRMRVWERGVGVTQACGTGACASAVAAVRRGLTGRRVEVVLDGGPLTIAWREADGHVLMTGPVATAFSGTLGAELLDGRG
ncbi:MAG: diaminopimelate epimerase [Alphaproteobacteria bacterium]|jgi:diaminopimelate epimerase|nr:diaminopimelate epimerase [Alphaproteobacteria bacterium]